VSTWVARAAAEAAALGAQGRWRTVRTVDGGGPAFTLADGRQVVSFASNDYLGLSQHPAVRAAAHAAIEGYGTGVGSARLIVGGRPLHDALEAELAAWKQTEAALLFSTGFAANLGVLSTLGTAEVTVLSDERNHASIIDGCRFARARTVVYRHGDLDHLASLLAANAPAIVVTDTVFSMDGDVADVAALVSLCAGCGALLVLDEAHAVLGPEIAVNGDVLRVGTLSKTLGSLGGYVAGPAPIIDLLRNRARSFIFTTASTPADTAAASAALGVLQSPEGAARIARLRALVHRLRPGHPSPIVPVVLGDEHAALAAAATLLDDGLLVPAIRPPTVPPGTSRLRVALSALHADADVERLCRALDVLHAVA